MLLIALELASTLAFGGSKQERTGALSTSDPSLYSAERYAHFTVPVVAGKKLTVALESDAFDPFLHVTLPGGAALENDDCNKGKPSACVSVVPTADGDADVIITSSAIGGVGPWTLTYETSPRAALAAPAGPHTLTVKGHPLRIGEAAAVPQVATRGKLTTSDEQTSAGAAADNYAFYAYGGSKATIRLQAGYDARLTTSATGVTAADAPATGGRTLTVTPAQNELVSVTVAAAAKGVTGDYTLYVEGLNPVNALPEPVPWVAPPASVDSLQALLDSGNLNAVVDQIEISDVLATPAYQTAQSASPPAATVKLPTFRAGALSKQLGDAVRAAPSMFKEYKGDLLPDEVWLSASKLQLDGATRTLVVTSPGAVKLTGEYGAYNSPEEANKVAEAVVAQVTGTPIPGYAYTGAWETKDGLRQFVLRPSDPKQATVRVYTVKQAASGAFADLVGDQWQVAIDIEKMLLW